uniref:USP domain-containing protein n=1 Tax=Arcella intermedia TaxID=1963864 RepID=A0A6B2KZ18_9EUKA
MSINSDIYKSLDAVFIHKNVWILEVPSVLIFQPIRFSNENNKKRKNNSQMHIDIDIDIARYTIFHEDKTREICGQINNLEAKLAELKKQLEEINAGPVVINNITTLLQESDPEAQNEAPVTLEDLIPQLKERSNYYEKKILEIQHQITKYQEEIHKAFSGVEGYPYTLYSVCIHSGASPTTGHYWTFIRNFNEQDSWFKLSDSFTSFVHLNEVLHNAVGGNGNESAYYLVYIERNMIEEVAKGQLQLKLVTEHLSHQISMKEREQHNQSDKENMKCEKNTDSNEDKENLKPLVPNNEDEAPHSEVNQKVEMRKKLKLLSDLLVPEDIKKIAETENNALLEKIWPTENEMELAINEPGNKKHELFADLVIAEKKLLDEIELDVFDPRILSIGLYAKYCAYSFEHCIGFILNENYSNIFKDSSLKNEIFSESGDIKRIKLLFQQKMNLVATEEAEYFLRHCLLTLDHQFIHNHFQTNREYYNYIMKGFTLFQAEQWVPALEVFSYSHFVYEKHNASISSMFNITPVLRLILIIFIQRSTTFVRNRKIMEGADLLKKGLSILQTHFPKEIKDEWVDRLRGGSIDAFVECPGDHEEMVGDIFILWTEEGEGEGPTEPVKPNLDSITDWTLFAKELKEKYSQFTLGTQSIVEEYKQPPLPPLFETKTVTQ